eukprot:1067168-Prorocentrum_minimum.AAC.1
MLADKPAEMLANYNKITLEGDGALLPVDAKTKKDVGSDAEEEEEEEEEELGGATVDVRTHKSTTGEVMALVEDLRVLGKKEFKHLMKWCVLWRHPLYSPSTQRW